MNTFIFTFVRMNPPTPGHLELIKNMIYKSIELNCDKIYIITSSSYDNKNPLPCDSLPKMSETPSKSKKKQKIEEKEFVMQSFDNFVFKLNILNLMIESYKHELIDNESDATMKSKINDLNIIVKCSTGSPFQFIFKTLETDFNVENNISIFAVVGRDRAPFFDTMVEQFLKKDYVSQVDGIILEREGMEELKNSVEDIDVTQIPTSALSASYVRNLVEKGDESNFNLIYNKYLEQDNIEKLYNTIKYGITLPGPKSSGKNKDEDPNPISVYENQLPIKKDSLGKGGNKRKKTYKRRTKKRKTKKRKYK